MGRSRHKNRWPWVTLAVIPVPAAVFFVSRATIRPHSSLYALLFSTLAAVAIIVLAAAIALLRRRCPACGKLRWKSVNADGREMLSCRSCGYEDATGWVYKAGGSLH